MSMLLVSCDMLEGVYDDPESEESESYFNADAHQGEFTLDCSSYTVWNYVNFHTDTYEPAFNVANIDVDTQLEDTTYADWDVAMHRYDVRTNGAECMETDYTSLSDFLADAVIPEGTWVPDSAGQVIIDMSGMMQGVIGYQATTKNYEACKWLDVDTSTMPPIYTLSGKVYLLKFSDGTYLAWHLKNYMNAKSVKGYMNVEYVYPVFYEK